MVFAAIVSVLLFALKTTEQQVSLLHRSRVIVELESFDTRGD